jgi:hypothetical protein
MSKKIVVSAISIVFIVLGCFSYIWFNSGKTAKKIYPKVPLTLVLDWELTKPIELQVFYTTDQDQNFNEKLSVRKKVTVDDKHVEVVIPEDKIYRFRIDLGSKPEKVILKNVEIMADQYINFNDWYSYAYMNIDKSKVNKDDNSLTILSSHGDPYMYWSLPFVLYKNE